MTEETKRKLHYAKIGKPLVFSNPEERSRKISESLHSSEAAKLHYASIGEKFKASERRQAYYDRVRLENLERKQLGIKRIVSEETRKKQSERAKLRKRSPMSEETKRKIGEANKFLHLGTHHTLEHRQHQSDALKGKRKSFLARIHMRGPRKEPTKTEARLIGVIKDFSLPFEYTGLRTFYVGRRNPDFKHIEKNICIEIDGAAHRVWRKDDIARNQVYKDAGWKVIVITDIMMQNYSDQVLANLILQQSI